VHVNYSIWGWVGASNNDPVRGLHTRKSCPAPCWTLKNHNVTCAGAEWVTWAYWSSAILRHTTFSMIVTIFWVHSVLEKSLKMLEFGLKNFKALESAWKQIRCLKVLEKSLNLSPANFEILLLSLWYWWVQYSTLQCHIAVWILNVHV